MRADLIGNPGFQPVKILAFEVFRTGVGRILARQVDAPCVVVFQRDFGEDRFDTVDHELQNSTRISFIDLFALCPRNAEQRQRDIASHCELDHRTPQFFRQIVLIEQTFLLFHIFGCQQCVDGVTHFGDPVNVIIDEPRKCPARAAKIKRLSAANPKQRSLTIPVLTGIVRQMRPQL